MDSDSTQKNNGIFSGLARFFGGRRKVTEEELRELMTASEEEGLINEDESEMIQAIFTLGETVVREVMVPRTDMAVVSVDAGAEELLETIISCGHSRIPIFDGTVDNITGVLYAKDLLRFWRKDPAEIDISRIARQPFFIPETKNLEELLQEFRKRRVHIAIVIDEYGGTSGLITIEDLLEQIVGDIMDEHDVEDDLLQTESADAAIIDARLPIEDFENFFKVSVERDKFDTVGGLICYLLGHIPAVGDEISCSSIQLTVLSAGERRIGKIRAHRISEPQTGQDQA